MDCLKIPYGHSGCRRFKGTYLQPYGNYLLPKRRKGFRSRQTWRGPFFRRSLNGREIAAVIVLSDGYTFDSCRRGLCGIAKHRRTGMVQRAWPDTFCNKREENTASTEEHIGDQPNGTLVENGKGGRILAGVANRNMQVKFLLP